MHIRKQIAKEAVLRCATEYVRRGWNVFFPLDEDGPIDFVVYKNEIFRRIQVKATKLRGGKVSVRLRSTNNWNSHTYTCRDCDVVVAYDYASRKGYKVDLIDFEGMPEVTLRVLPAKNGQRKGTRAAEPYLFFTEV